ncbi:MAG: TonB-dependent receptor plug domain-containing protein [Muribaculaceae bacterium]|nr:TonB-dependent receptor plug domain-containing protein [Muribaculaceae bacterium]
MNLKFIIFVIFSFIVINNLYAEETSDSTQVYDLDEIIVTDQSARNRIQGLPGSETLELTKLALTPQLFGEPDIIKSITLLPGVHAESEGAGGFEVRGGNAYQNLVLMDGMTLYNPSHMMGIFSTFNEDAMSQATLHKGPIPSSFGSAASSVLETQMKHGNLSKYNFSATIGILNAKVSAEGPIVKDKLSFAISARRSYVDLFLNLIPKYKGTVMNFYDINAKVRYNVDENNIIDFSFFTSRDNLAVKDVMELHWGNLSGGVNWWSNHDDWNFYTTGSVTQFTNNMGSTIMDSNNTLKEHIKSFSLNERITYDISENHKLEIGFRSELLNVKSGEVSSGNTHQKEIRSGWLNALWAGYEGTVSSKLKINIGLRGSLFSSISSGKFHSFEAFNETSPDFSSKSYFNLEPRVGLRFLINDCHSVNAGVSLTTQDIHGIRATMTTFPFDRYALSSANIKPETTRQFTLGYAGMTDNGSWDWSLEGYYKSMDNVYDYKDGVGMFSRINLESIILGGKGRSYGLELMLRKNIGKLSGWIAYTLSKTETKITGINNGRWYRASNDRRNDLSIVGLYQFNDSWGVSASWTFSSGRPLTAPDEKYIIDGVTCYYYSERNSYITPSSHRLDVSATYTRTGKKTTSILSFGFFNAYAHYSPFVIYFEDDPSKPSGTRAVQQSLFGIVPSFSYTIKF